MLEYAIITTLFIILLAIKTFSLTFRNSYLKTKLRNRVDDKQWEIISKTIDDFWSFIK